MIINQFLQNESSSSLAVHHHTLLTTAAQSKYSEQFAVFLSQIYSHDIAAFKEVVVSLQGHC